MAPSMRSALLSFVSILGLLTVPAWGATAGYPDLPGSGEGEVDFIDISETSNTDPLPLFGEPTRMGNQLFFFPTGFVSTSDNGDLGMTDETSSTLDVTIVADEGYYIQSITFSELGDYIVTGIGTDATFASVTGTMTAKPGNILANLEIVPAPPYYSPSSGAYQGYAVIDLSGMNITEVMLGIQNTLQTGSEAHTTASIQKNIISAPTIDVMVIPEPGCLFLLALGGAALIRRRRA